MTIYVVSLYLKAQYTFGTGTEVFRDTNCIVLASASVVDRDALIHIFDTKTIDPAAKPRRRKKPRRMILCVTTVSSRFQGVALIGLDSVPVGFIFSGVVGEKQGGGTLPSWNSPTEHEIEFASTHYKVQCRT